MKHFAKTLLFIFVLTFCIKQSAFSNPLLLKEIERTENLIPILEASNSSLLENETLINAKKNLRIAREMQHQNKIGIALKRNFEAKNSILKLLDENYGEGTSEAVKRFFQTENFLEKVRPDIRKAQNFESINSFISANEKLDSAKIEMGNGNFTRTESLTNKANILAQTAYKMAKIDNKDLTETETFNFIKITDNFLRKAKPFISKENFETAKDLQENAWQKFSHKKFGDSIEISKSVRTILKSNFSDEFGEDNLSSEFVKNLLEVAENRILFLAQKIKENPSKGRVRFLRKIRLHFNKAKNEFQKGNLKGAILELKICRNLKKEFQGE